ncbi:MAG: hypothetical protein JWR72_1920, partial [Flavisolibacter sp.]|nr:hypothetical protein [Flavisolibacter sp.]
YPNNYRYRLGKVDNLMNKVRQHQQSKIINRIAELNYKVRDRAKELILAA